MAVNCRHVDVRYFEDELRAIACMVCGRLFGHLDEQERMIPHNPPDIQQGRLSQWCPVCKSYHVYVGEQTDAGVVTRACPKIPTDDPRYYGSPVYTGSRGTP
jgi:hypothetical protein